MNYSIQTGQLYLGDCAQGDREAAVEEIAAWELSRLPTPRDLLAKLDADNALTQRNLREFIMLTAEVLKNGTPMDVTVLPGVQGVYAVEAQAATLRAQL